MKKKAKIIAFIFVLFVKFGVWEICAEPAFYYYDKYNTITTYNTIDTKPTDKEVTHFPFSFRSFIYNAGAPYIVVGNYYNGNSYNSQSIPKGASAVSDSYKDGETYSSGIIYYCSTSGIYYYGSFSINPSYTKGAIVQNGLIAPDGMYPNNGRHIDGYWYVKGGVANINPIIFLNIPTSNSPLQGRQAYMKGAA